MIKTDPDYVIRLLQDLVRINSINPSLAPSAPGEAEIGRHIADVLRAAGAEVWSHEPEPGRVSTVGRVKGSGGGRSLMLNAHIDTVSVEGMAAPFSGEIKNGRLYGRGSYDMKGSAAACIGAIRALASAPNRLAGDVYVSLVADEEHSSLGTQDLVGRYPVDGAIVTEPSALDICLAHKGFIWIDVETVGRAYHGSQYQHGIDANLRMGRFLSRLERLERELRHRPAHPLVGPPTLHAAVMSGGTGRSTYAASATVQIERRTIPGETEAQVLGEIEALLAELRREDSSFEASARVVLTRDPFEVAPEAGIVTTLSSAATSVTGRTPKFRGENPWMDSALFSAAGAETVVYGPDGAGAHSDEEWVELDTVTQLSQVLAETAVAYCGGSSRSGAGTRPG